MKKRGLIALMLTLVLALSLCMASPALADGVSVKVDGADAAINAVVTENGCFAKIEELAAALAGTDSAFDVAVDANNKRILTHRGGEFQESVTVESEVPEREPAAWTLWVDGAQTQPIGWLTDGDDLLVNVKDISILYGFGAAYDEETATLALTTGVGYPLELNIDDYTTGSIQVFGEEVNFKVYNVVYVTDPKVVAYEVMKIYVPETATQASPVFFPLTTGAHNHADTNAPFDVDESNINNPSSGTVCIGGMEAASYLMSKGWVVATAAARGLDTFLEEDGVTIRAGVAPNCITDFKAAIRYLKYNDEILPGDSNKIVVTGTSGGGTMTTILGASGNAPYFAPYLEEIGAADTSDDVFAAVPYCPVADIDNQGPAFDWVFHGVTLPNRTDEKLAVLAEEVARTFTYYINGLGYTAEDGTPLTLDPETMDGAFKQYFCDEIAKGLTHVMTVNGYVAEDGTLTEEGQAWFDAKMTKTERSGEVTELEYAPADVFGWENGAATFDAANYDKYLSLYAANLFFPKAIPSFDNGLVYGDVTVPVFDSINQLFSTKVTDLDNWEHFEVDLANSVERANERIGEEYFRSAKGSLEVPDDVQRNVAAYNALYYLKDVSGLADQGLNVNKYASEFLGSSDVAPYWHLRVGTWDHLVSTATEAALNLALRECEDVEEVDFMIWFGQMHTGWYDNSEMVEWLQEICK